VLVGGTPEAVARARPMLACFAGAIVRCGPLGSGTVAKLCVQTMQYVAWAATYDALALGRAAGLSEDAFTAATEAAGVVSPAHRRFLGLHRRPASERAAAPFQAQLAAFVDLAGKDLEAVLALGEECGVPAPTAAAAGAWLARMYGLDEGGARPVRRDREPTEPV